MNKVFLLKQRLQAIADSIETHPQGLGLLGLGSAGKEIQRMDEYSDLDFFIIVETGYKQQFIENLDWLSNIQPIAWCFKNTDDGYKLLFNDGVFCEFGVFDPDELAHIAYSEGEFIWKQDHLDENFKTPVLSPPEAIHDETFLLGELLTNLYVGLCRLKRGERCSAMRFIQVYALDRLISLLDLKASYLEPVDDKSFEADASLKDAFCPDRRVEQRHARYQQLLSDCSQGIDKSILSARTMLEFVKTHYSVNAAIEKEIRTLL
jgi:hypothetical protein